MRICVAYDCLFPHTVGGAERWYRNLAERLAAEGHEVTFFTRRQWARGEQPDAPPGVRVLAPGPRIGLYTADGRRRIDEALLYGASMLWHLLRHGRRYDVVHTASFPYFSLLAAGLLRRWGGYALVVDWHEVWSREYWREYLGGAGGLVGLTVQRACARVAQRAFCFSRLHARRLVQEGLRGSVTVLEGEYAGDLHGSPAREPEPVVVFAGRLIPEKRAPLGVRAVALAAQSIRGLRGEFYGDGPDRTALDAAVAQESPDGAITAPGFVASEEIDAALSRALCMLLPSSREGYGMVVVEAAARATPSVVVPGPDNAAVELVADGVNGVIAAGESPQDIAAAIARVHAAGMSLRRSTERWFAENARGLSLESSLERVLEAYAGPIRQEMS